MKVTAGVQTGYMGDVLDRAHGRHLIRREPRGSDAVESESPCGSEIGVCYESHARRAHDGPLPRVRNQSADSYEVLQRFKRFGAEGLEPQSRAPKRIPHRMNAELAELVIAARREHPTWGPKKIKADLE